MKSVETSTRSRNDGEAFPWYQNSCQTIKMSTSSAPLLRICHFDGPFFPLQPYFCYNNEVCCKEGCCSEYDYKYFQSWYFWYKFYTVLGIIVLFVLYRYICWFCKKNERNNNIRSLTTPRISEENVNSHIVNLMVSYNNRVAATYMKDEDDDESSDPPPMYNVAIHLPKPHTSDEIPTYEEATSTNL